MKLCPDVLHGEAQRLAEPPREGGIVPVLLMASNEIPKTGTDFLFTAANFSVRSGITHRAPIEHVTGVQIDLWRRT